MQHRIVPLLFQRAVFQTVCALVLVTFPFALPAQADLAQTIDKIRPSIVGVGTYQRTRGPAVAVLGTGFAVGDGQYVITNAHVTPAFLNAEKKETLIVLVGRGREVQPREAEEVAQDTDHDLALLKIKGAPLPPLVLGDASTVREGQEFAFTGFPIGAILGLYPVTHRAMVSALTPIVIPGQGSRELDVKSVTRLRNAFEVFQLDATAYPGNSGSPLYNLETGQVIGVLNMVFVKETKERVLANPSGIAYAIPVNYINALLSRAGVKQ